MTRQQFAIDHPDFPLLAPGETTALSRVLLGCGQLGEGERVTEVARAGEGNMNLTLRVHIAGGAAPRTLIVKQSRPWVEKYDFIAAPWDRANIEALFMQHAARVPPVARRMPRLLGHDSAACVLVMEDLGPGTDLSTIYRGESTRDDDLPQLAEWLCSLHASSARWTGEPLTNREMRGLNHAHIFEIPLANPPAIDLAALQQELPAAADALRQDKQYRKVVAEAARRYLADGPTLLHGDFFPGSWLRAGERLYVIDAEFGHFGDASFDLGVTVAHLALAGCRCADARRFLAAYDAPFDRAALSTTAAIEVMRRLIGVAQLPLANSLDRAALLRKSRLAALEHEWELLWDN